MQLYADDLYVTCSRKRARVLIGPKISISTKYMQTIPIVLPSLLLSKRDSNPPTTRPLHVDRDGWVNRRGHWQLPSYEVLTNKHCTHVI